MNDRPPDGGRPGHRLRAVEEKGARSTPVVPPQRFGFFLVPQFPMMAFTSAVEPMRAANRHAVKELYTWQVISADEQPVTASNGIDVGAHVGLGDVGRGHGM